MYKRNGIATVVIQSNKSVKSNSYSPVLSVSSIEDEMDNVLKQKMELEDSWKKYYVDKMTLASTEDVVPSLNLLCGCVLEERA